MSASVRLPFRTLLLGMIIAAALMLCWWAGRISRPASAALPSLTEPEQQAQLTLLSAYGWEVDPTPVCDTVTLPEDFSSKSYEGYLALQEECGYQLAPFAGKTVLRCTYAVLNYPGGETDVYATLLAADGTIIGGDIRSSKLDGFMQSLRYPD